MIPSPFESLSCNAWKPFLAILPSESTVESPNSSCPSEIIPSAFLSNTRSASCGATQPTFSAISFASKSKCTPLALEVKSKPFPCISITNGSTGILNVLALKYSLLSFLIFEKYMSDEMLEFHTFNRIIILSILS